MKSLKMGLLDTYTYKEKNAGPVLFIAWTYMDLFVSYTVEQYMKQMCNIF